MTELTARTAAEAQEDGQRPGWFRVLAWTWVAQAGGMLAAGLALMAPWALGVAVATPDFEHGWSAPYVADGAGAVLANVAVALLLIWGMTLTARPLVGWATDATLAWTWTALPIACGLSLAAIAPAVAVTGGLAIAGLLLRYTAFDGYGRARPEPFAALWASRWRWAAGAALPAILVACATGYAIYHPLRAAWPSGGEGTDAASPVKAVRAPLVVLGPSLTNQGGRSMRVLAVEPGRERGYALHLSGVKMENMGVMLPGQPTTLPFKPFVLGPHQERGDLAMVVSRAGCQPGATGRIDSVRVRYRLGGEHTMELRLAEPLVLSC